MRKLFTLGADTHGKGPVIFKWSPKGGYLATCGTQRKLYIWDRNGQLYDEIHLASAEYEGKGVYGIAVDEGAYPAANALEWDSTGERLAVLPLGTQALVLYTVSTRETSNIDVQMRDMCFLTWGVNSAVLAVGTGKGNVLIYNDTLGKKIPIMGKHTRKITCGAWNHQGRLVLGGDDKQVTISKADGDTVRQVTIRQEPYEIFFNSSKKGEASASRNTISVNVGRKTIFLVNALGKDEQGEKIEPVELAFQEKYGMILTHRWFGDGYLVVGFTSGWLVVISTHNKEMSEEVHSQQYNEAGLKGMAYCEALDRVAICGGHQVKIIDMHGQECQELKNEGVDLDYGAQCESIQWTRDGQVLTVATATGEVHTFLASLPVVHAACETRVVYLTSLLELSVTDVLTKEHHSVDIETEPAFVALGPGHVATGMNNQAWFYRLDPSDLASKSVRVNQRDYLGTVEEVRLNERFAAVLSEGRVQLHFIEAGMDPSEEGDIIFPGQGPVNDLTCVAITPAFLIFGSKRGTITYFFLEGRATVNEYRHQDGEIKKLFPNTIGTRCLFVDAQSQVILFNPVNDQILAVPDYSGPVTACLWDTVDPNVFVLADGRKLHVYVYAPVAMNGAMVTHVGTTPLPAGFVPMQLYNGVVTCQLKSGSLETVVLQTHTALQASADRNLSLEIVKRRFLQHLALLHFKEAWEVAMQVNSPEMWNRLREAALFHMELDTAVEAYRIADNPSMVLSLERIRSVEDKNLLAGHIIVLLEQDYNQAQELFLKSSQPLAALEMRKDLKQWDLALKLAKQLKPDELGSIYRENGAMLEMRGEFENALSCFERSLQHSPSDAANTALCRNGVARCTLHAGDIRRGRDLCLERNDVALFRECASILEGLNQMQESAEMYERGRLYEKAASIYIQTKSFARAQPLMAKINTPKLHVQYARAKEAEAKYDEAAVAYEMAKDTDSVVRLLLRYLNNPQKAFALVRRTRSTEGALMVAKFCQSGQDFPAAIEFLLMARRQDEAFELAQVHEAMDTYALIVGQSGQPEDYEKLASYYERKPGSEAQAGENYEKCGKYQQALRLYLKVGVAKIDAAINVVGRANNDILTNQLVDFLMGETDGIQKDHNYLFRLHMALQQFEQAAHTAVLIARQEQEMGNYKVAHAQLFDTFKELESQGKRAPTELNRQLLLLHSYVLVKTLVKLNDHAAAARMLTRVAKNISRFPRHIVPILTSTVIECQRAGFKKTAFDYASMLMRPENRKTISEQYKRKIENIVRKPEKEVVESDAKDEEVACPCPFCNTPGSETDLECDSCKNVIPYCIATGKRMVVSDWAQCPSCRFPCRASVFVKIITLERNCPMCNQQIVLSQIHKMADPITALKQQQALLQNNQREPEPELDREE